MRHLWFAPFFYLNNMAQFTHLFNRRTGQGNLRILEVTSVNIFMYRGCAWFCLCFLSWGILSFPLWLRFQKYVLWTKCCSKHFLSTDPRAYREFRAIKARADFFIVHNRNFWTCWVFLEHLEITGIPGYSQWCSGIAGKHRNSQKRARAILELLSRICLPLQKCTEHRHKVRSNIVWSLKFA